MAKREIDTIGDIRQLAKNLDSLGDRVSGLSALNFVCCAHSIANEIWSYSAQLKNIESNYHARNSDS
jgi:hypothetical protein